MKTKTTPFESFFLVFLAAIIAVLGCIGVSFGKFLLRSVPRPWNFLFLGVLFSFGIFVAIVLDRP